eukprot:2725043-Rhodomonas_salina.2
MGAKGNISTGHGIASYGREIAVPSSACVASCIARAHVAWRGGRGWRERGREGGREGGRERGRGGEEGREGGREGCLLYTSPSPRDRG